MRLQNKEQHFVSVFILSPPLYLAPPPPLRGQKLNKLPGGLIELLRYDTLYMCSLSRFRKYFACTQFHNEMYIAQFKCIQLTSKQL